MTDQELVRAARAGDGGAHAALVSRYQRQITYLAASLVGDFAEGEDLAQEAFVRAFRNLDLLADPSRFGPWLRRIAFGVSVDWLRTFRPGLYRADPGGEGKEPADDRPSPLDRLLRTELTVRVASALAALPPRYRVPLRMFHLDGISHAKIGAALGMPVGTVRSLVARARRRLAPLLAELAPEARTQVEEVFEEQIVTEAVPSTRFLHVANGSSTTGTIARAGIPGTLSLWADPLHEGPVPGDVTDDELLNVRARHLAPPDHASAEVAAELERWRDTLDRFTQYPELVLWYEHDLFDQLNLIQVLDRLARQSRGKTKVSLISIGSFPGRPSFKGLGELTPDELASLFDTRQLLEDRHFAVAQAAWRAFRAADPRALRDLLSTDLSALPFLTAALGRHLEEFPSATNGLSRSEQHLLDLVAGGQSDIWQLFPLMHEGEGCFYIADLSFGRVFGDLAASAPPLLDVDIESRAPGMLPRGRLTLTAAGRDVLAGRADRVDRCGIDRWLGGVHLTTESVWRWDRDNASITHQLTPPELA